MKYSDVKLGENCNQETEEWSVEKHTEQTSTDAYGVINFQGGSHSYRAKVCMAISSKLGLLTLNNLIQMVDASFNFWQWRLKDENEVYWGKTMTFVIIAFLLWFEVFLISFI